MDSVSFREVKDILDSLVKTWEQQAGFEADLLVHSDDFGWETRDQLLNATAFDRRLLQPDLVGMPGQGASTNLIVALSKIGGVEGAGQMPPEGPFITSENLSKIVAWIEAGAPE